MAKSKQKLKRMIGVFDGLRQGGTVNACFPCANKYKLDLCGTPSEKSYCEYCNAESIYENQ